MTKKMMKRILSFVLVAAVSISVMMPVAASPVIHVFLDGVQLRFEVAPRIMNGRTVVPLRDIFEALGAEVEWDGATQTVTATRDDTVVVLTIGSTSPTVNGRVVTIDQAGVVIDGRTLVPLRFVGEAFGIDVEWNSAASTIIIGDGTGVVLPAPVEPHEWMTAYINVLRENEAAIHFATETLFFTNQHPDRVVSIIHLIDRDVPQLVFFRNYEGDSEGSWLRTYEVRIYTFIDGQARNIYSRPIGFNEITGRFSLFTTAQGNISVYHGYSVGGGVGEFEFSFVNLIFDGSSLVYENAGLSIQSVWVVGDDTVLSFYFENQVISESEYEDRVRELLRDAETIIIDSNGGNRIDHSRFLGTPPEFPNVSMTLDDALRYLGS